jgi:hypothetical protein
MSNSARLRTRAHIARPARRSLPARRAAPHEPLRADATLRTRDLALLTWLAEQYAARTDHLEQLLGCSARTVQRTLARTRAAGLLETRGILVGEPAWAIPTAAGLRITGERYPLWRPRLALLAHVAAVNDVRLHVQRRSPAAEWVCERALARTHGSASEHLPDGVLLHDRRSIAIEVELTVKSAKRVRKILDELGGRYDDVAYFAAPAPHRQLTELSASGRWPKLTVRELPRRPQRVLP